MSAKRRVVIVVGASGSTGSACVDAFEALGDEVFGTYLNHRPEPETPSRLSCDVRNDDDVRRMVQTVQGRSGPVDVLVYCAGVSQKMCPIWALDPADLGEALAVNLQGIVKFLRAITPSMYRRRFGRVILLSSGGATTGLGGQAAYAASKAAIVGLARSVAREVAPRSVTVNIIAAGLLSTGMAIQMTAGQRERLLTQVPMGRLGTPAEVANAAVFLASEQAAFITGAVLPVDGGLSMGM